MFQMMLFTGVVIGCCPLEKSCHVLPKNARRQIGISREALVQEPSMTIDALNNILDELNAWKRAQMTATLWWRDDDAALPCVELDHLIRLSNEHAVPCGLAAIPMLAGEPLRKNISDAAYVWILQHGYAHKNYALPCSGAWELGLHRPKSAVLEDLRNGMLKFSQLFKSRFVPVVVQIGRASCRERV